MFSNLKSQISNPRFLAPLALAYLWFALINHLRVEWTLNPQYAYGWAVPFLCAYLLWDGRKTNAEVGSGLRISNPPPLSVSSVLKPFSAFQLFGVSVLAVCWFPIRLIQAANPDWRLISWALALIVIGLTLLLLQHSSLLAIRRSSGSASSASSVLDPCPGFFSISAFQRFSLFPLFFFLVAVPWPTGIEMPLIQGLTRANAAATIEVLNLLGISAIQHGNVIEVATGMVGIDEACSGIRSFQATLMLSLFFGQVYRLTVSRRCLAILAGFACSFLFNIVRTTLLTAVAAHDGVGAIAKWHDPAGVTILVACFLVLWLLTSKLGSHKLTASPDLKSQIPVLRNLGEGGSNPKFAATLLAWLVVCDLGVAGWYRWNERHLEAPVTWTIQLPDSSTLRQVPWSEKSRRMLRFSESTNIRWTEAAHPWAAIFMRWDPQTIGINLPNMHTPNVCLTASGFDLVSQSEVRPVSAGNLQLPCRFYRFQSPQGPVNVLYCLWEDYQPKGHLASPAFTRQMRLSAVLQGRRNLSQRSLELAVWGVEDTSQAEKLLAEQVSKIVVRK